MTDITELALTEINDGMAELRRISEQPAVSTHYARVLRKYVASLVEALKKAQRAGSINHQWKPDVCPITGRRFFLWIEHPELGCVPTYGGPYDSYTIPTRDSDGEFSCERYDHDVGGWVDGECVGAYLIDDDEQSRVFELEKRIAELEREREHLRPVGVMSEKAYHRLENRESRFIALWPRPGIYLPRKRPEDGVIVYARTAVAAPQEAK